MNITKTNISDLLIIEPRVFDDSRGLFFESYNQKKFSTFNLNYSFVQDNRSVSSYGTIRGLHFQTGEYGQAKLVEVVSGEVLDVAVDLRPNSPTFGDQFSVLLSGSNKKQLLIPRGFAHGFSVLSETAIFSYKCDNFYSAGHESGIIFNDSTLDIDWKIPTSKQSLSEKDLKLKKFQDIKSSLL